MVGYICGRRCGGGRRRRRAASRSSTTLAELPQSDSCGIRRLAVILVVLKHRLRRHKRSRVVPLLKLDRALSIKEFRAFGRTLQRSIQSRQRLARAGLIQPRQDHRVATLIHRRRSHRSESQIELGPELGGEKPILVVRNEALLSIIELLGERLFERHELRRGTQRQRQESRRERVTFGSVALAPTTVNGTSPWSSRRSSRGSGRQIDRPRRCR